MALPPNGRVSLVLTADLLQLWFEEWYIDTTGP